MARLMGLVILGLCTMWPSRVDGQPPDQDKLQPRLIVQAGPAKGVAGTSVSADGRLLVTVGKDENVVFLWEVATGRELRRYSVPISPKESTVVAAILTAEGRFFITTETARPARLWEIATGKVIREFDKASIGLRTGAISTDGEILFGVKEGSIRRWEVRTGHAGLMVSEDLVKAKGWTPSLSISQDGKVLLAVDSDKEEARVIDLTQNRLVWTLETPFASLAPNGRQLLWLKTTTRSNREFKEKALSPISTTHVDIQLVVNEPCLSDLSTRKAQIDFPSPTRHLLNSVVFAQDGKLIVGIGSGYAIGWDATSAKIVKEFRWEPERLPEKGDLLITALPRDGNRLLLAKANAYFTQKAWEIGKVLDLATDRVSHVIQGEAAPVMQVGFSPDGQRIAFGFWETGEVAVWDARRGNEISRFRGGGGVRSKLGGWDPGVWAKVLEPLYRNHGNLRLPMAEVSSTPNGQRVLYTLTENKKAVLAETASGKVLQTFLGHTAPIRALALSSDGKYALTASEDQTTRWWDAATGKELLCLKDHAGTVACVAIATEQRWLATGCEGIGPVLVWDRVDGKRIQQLQPREKQLQTVRFAPDNRSLWTLSYGDYHAVAQQWDVVSGKEIQSYEAEHLAGMAISPDGRLFLEGSMSGAVRLREAATCKLLCTLACFRDGSWAVVDPDGRFDASNGGDIDGLHWVVGLETIGLAQLKERYYDPGLLAKYLGLNSEPLRQVAAFRELHLTPELKVMTPPKDSLKLGIDLTNRGGGIGKVVVLLNGKELTADARSAGHDPHAKELSLKLDLTGDPRVLAGKKNKIEVQVYNAAGYLRSRGFVLDLDAPGAVEQPPPQLYAVVVGVSTYHGSRLNLKFAAKDAEDFAAALRLAGGKLLGADKVHLTLLATTAKDEASQPTRSNILKALDAAKEKAKHGDLLVVYLAGHGINYGGQDGDFYYLTRDATSGVLIDPIVRREVAISSAELTERLKAIVAQRQVLILDTCASGKLIDKITEQRTVPASQIRALERVKDRSGIHILAGCSADAVSYEASRYTQGLLTYSLLLGMRGGALKDDQVDVGQLFAFAADLVPQLARDIGGIQKPVVASPRGGQSFPIGLLSAKERAQIPLQKVRPLVVRCQLQEETDFRDVLDLGKRLDERLRVTTARGRDAPLIFLDAAELPDGCLPIGRYRIEKGKVHVTLHLFQAEKLITRLTVTDDLSRLDALANELASQIEKALQNPPAK